MLLTYVRQDDRRQITVTTGGDVNVTDVISVIDRQAAEGTWTYRVLYDERASTTALTLEELRRIVDRVSVMSRRHGPRGPVAIVIGDAGNYSAGRVYEALAGSAKLSFRMFRDLDAAQAWLDESTNVAVPTTLT